MTKSKIIKYLQDMNWIGKHWRVKDFIIYEDKDLIKFSYIHGDMGNIDMIIFYKKDNYCEVYELNNYYGDTELYTSLYL